MATMTKSEAATQLLSMLKANLGYFDSAIPGSLATYLAQLIAKAEADLLEDGIVIDESSVDDGSLVVMYPAWLYRKAASGEGKPPMLQTAIRNRQVALAMAEEAAP